MNTLALGPSWLDPNTLLNQFGIWGLLLVVFAESGLLIGFFLPGDSLLFTTGLLITGDQLDFPLWAAIALICLAAVLGDQAGYLFGKKVGPSLFKRPDSKLFKQENVEKAHEFFEKYGPKSLVLARFVPVVRTFTPIIAGVSGMRYRSFITFNVIGGVLWGAGVTLLGSWLGQIDFVKKNIEFILVAIVLVSVIPIAIEYLRARGKSKKDGADGGPGQARQDSGPAAPSPYGDQERYGQAPYGQDAHGQGQQPGRHPQQYGYPAPGAAPYGGPQPPQNYGGYGRPGGYGQDAPQTTQPMPAVDPAVGPYGDRPQAGPQAAPQPQPPQDPPHGEPPSRGRHAKR
ncbi:VTT domain-containing protein [Streptomyces sp. NPDC049954]|uniref:DedA family protein n=1 Tax=Streptomyces sp. NPDC049954 TaxID=3155779 RepID=UPI003449155B